MSMQRRHRKDGSASESVIRGPLTIAQTRRIRTTGEATRINRGVCESVSSTRPICAPVSYCLSSSVACAIVKYRTEGSGTQMHYKGALTRPFGSCSHNSRRNSNVRLGIKPVSLYNLVLTQPKINHYERFAAMLSSLTAVISICQYAVISNVGHQVLDTSQRTSF